MKMSKNFLFSYFIGLVISFGCVSKVKYGANKDSILDTNLTSLKSSFNNQKQFKYSHAIEDRYWDDAYNAGFVTNTNDPGYNKFKAKSNNSLEKGLGYIFFNSLRNKMHNLGIVWKNIDEIQRNRNFNNKNVLCPKPWKYRLQIVEGEEYGVFYLPSVQMGEYNKLQPGGNIYKRNYDIISSDRRSPYVKCFLESNPNDYRAKLVVLDHLLQNDDFLVELPESVHIKKTRFLDKFNLYPPSPTRFTTISYWQNRKEFEDLDTMNQPDRLIALPRCANDFNPQADRCNMMFVQPQRGFIPVHDHSTSFKDNWSVKLRTFR